MFGSGILEIAIGMAFVYLLLSLICTAVSEWISAIFRLRATNLEKGIRCLVADGKLPDGTNIAQALYDHGLIKSMYRSDRFGRRGLPSYLPSRTFALTLFDVLAPADANGSKGVNEILQAVDKLPPGLAKQTLFTVIGQTKNNIEDARKAVEDWYDGGMDRVSGWYKRKTQVILIILAAFIAVGTNTDTILVAKTLWNTPTLRESTAKAAETFVQSHKDDATRVDVSAQQAAENVRTFNSKIQELGLPVGWPTAAGQNDPRDFPQCWSQLFWARLLGWLLTAVAVSFGAPFWFDTLNKFMVVRSTVKPAEKSQVEASKDAKPSPTPTP